MERQPSAPTEHHRPALRFTAPSQWINDPNGLVRHGGEYHLFFQCNPHGSGWDHMSWGHAVSDDLVHWRHLPVALEMWSNAATGEDTHIYSGTVVPMSVVLGAGGRRIAGVPDEADLVAYYTAHVTRADEVVERQELAWSCDDGLTWTLHPANPVLDRGRRDFRDPRVFFDTAADRWAMAVAAPRSHSVEFYASHDGITWEPTGVYEHPEQETILECPDLVQLRIDGTDRRAWVLLYSIGHPTNEVSGRVLYVVGEWSGGTFLAAPNTAPLPVDSGRDYFALQCFAGLEPDEDAIAIAWASSWPYAAVTPTAPWRGAMTSPRRLTLAETPDGVRLRQHSVLGAEDGEAVDFAMVSGPATVRWNSSLRAGAECSGVRLVDTAGGLLEIAVDPRRGLLTTDRRGASDVSFHPSFAGVAAAVLPAIEGHPSVDVEVMIDGSVIEVFAGDGLVAQTSSCFFSTGRLRLEPFGPIDGLSCFGVSPTTQTL
jgi:sucrose-6-phosphate hydrolase SacC (GH32 family)